MKQTIILFLCVLFGTPLFSQSLEIIYNGVPVGDTLELTVSDVENFETYYLDIANISTRSINVLVRRENISTLEGSSNMFCFGSNCFDSDMSMETFYIAGNDTFSYEKYGTDAFHVTYYAGGKFGKSIVKYSFVNNMMEEDLTPLIVVFNSTSAGVETADNSDGIYAYPNPTTGKFTVAVPESSSLSQHKTELYDASGKLVFSSAGNSVENSGHFDITNYPSGIYFINIFNENKNHIIKLQKK